MKVNIATSEGMRGGPFKWAENLTYLINNRCNGQIKMQHIFKFKDLIKIPIYQNADIVHTIHPIPFRLWKKPYILSIKGEYTIEKNFSRPFYPIAIKKADVITTPSIFLKEKLKLHDAIVIPNAIFPEQYKMAPAMEKNEINLVTITNFGFKDKSEGIYEILKIIKKVQNSVDRKINYIIVGGGKYFEEIKRTANNISRQVNFTGYQAKPDSYLEKSDIFLYYSVHDNFPNVFLEAMASGLPLITNNVGAAPEIIQNSVDGYIAESQDEYEKYLLDLISDWQLRQKTGENARRTVEQRFDWNKIVDDYITLYNSLV